MPRSPPSQWDESWSVQLYSLAESGNSKGIGESLLAGGIPPEVIQWLINRFLSPRLTGKDLEPREANELMMKAVFSAGLSGISMIGVSGVDVAIWDLKGKMLGKHISELLASEGYPLNGGESTAEEIRVPVYASLPRFAHCQALIEAVGRAEKAGFNMVKLHQSPASSLRCLKEVREAFPKIRIAVDLNCGFSEVKAEQELSAMSSYGVEWFEEPIWPPDDYSGLRHLACMGFPLAAGEDEYRPLGFERLCEAGVKYLQPDVSKVGGITRFLEVSKVAEDYGVPLAAHVRPHASYVNAAATLALSGSVRQVSMVEFPYFPFSPRLFTNLPTVSNGVASVKKLPGIGTEFLLADYAYSEQQRALDFADLDGLNFSGRREKSLGAWSKLLVCFRSSRSSCPLRFLSLFRFS